MKSNFYMLNSMSEARSVSAMNLNSTTPMIQIPKITSPQNFYKPSLGTRVGSVNLIPSTAKALSQQGPPPPSIKSYLSSVKISKIDLSADMNKYTSQSKGTSSAHHHKFSPYQMDRRSDSVDARLQ